MRDLHILVAFIASCAWYHLIAAADDTCPALPFVNGALKFAGGTVLPFEGEVIPVTSPVRDALGERSVIGSMAQMTEADALAVLEAAKTAWGRGQGEWPQMSAAGRIRAIEAVVRALRERRAEIVEALMWEICKSAADAEAEFDRTMDFIAATIEAFRAQDAAQGSLRTVGGVLALVRRAAIGIMLCLGPFNYPLNETYATLIPALLLGNVVVMKVPSVGGLAHMLTVEAFAQHLPPGVVNFVTGSGRTTMGPLMKTGDIDVLAFIGGSGAADALIKTHPHPHRLRVFLQLEGKNIGLVMEDADLAVAVEQVTVGATAFNGQRCTAIKLVFVHESVAEEFVAMLTQSIGGLVVGQPWTPSVKITPLPERNKPAFLQELVADATKHGARVTNPGGGALDGSLMVPAVLYPVTSAMRVFHEEQFGPVVPVAVYRDIDEVVHYIRDTPFGQQAAVFTRSASSLGPVVDILSTAVGRININTQCGRSPDSVPFSGRRSSALGTMSVTEALSAFSTETVVAGKAVSLNEELIHALPGHSKFMQPLL